MEFDFEYGNVKCPTCVQNGITDSTMGLVLATGKFTCTAQNRHEFDQLPGEMVPPPVAEEVAEAKRLDPETAVLVMEDASIETPVSQEVKDAEEKRLVEITEKIKLGDPDDPKSPYWHGKQAVVVLPPVVTDWSQCCVCRPGDAEGHYCDKHAAELGIPVEHPDPRFDRPQSPLVRVGEFAALPGGDVLVGVRLAEMWTGNMQSEAESRQPPISLAEYVQELVDLGLLSYYGSEVVK